MKNVESVVVLGASPKEDRFSNRAVRLLLDHGHDVIPVHPVAETIHGADVAAFLEDVTEHIDTISLYLSPQRSWSLAGAIIQVAPRRVIFNPGTESEALEHILEQNGIVVQKDCTLVLLNTGRF